MNLNSRPARFIARYAEAVKGAKTLVGLRYVTSCYRVVTADAERKAASMTAEDFAEFRAGVTKAGIDPNGLWMELYSPIVCPLVVMLIYALYNDSPVPTVLVLRALSGGGLISQWPDGAYRLTSAGGAVLKEHSRSSNN